VTRLAVGLSLFFCFFLGRAGSAQAQMLQLDNPEGKTAVAPTVKNTTPEPTVDERPHALAVRARWVTVPGWELSPYTTAHTQLNGGFSFGAEYLYLMKNFDVVISLDYSWLNADSGNFLARNHIPATDTHFIAFDKLSSLSLDASIIGHWNLASWLEIRVGAGLGLGVVFGNIYQINSGGCNAMNLDDLSKCYPRNQNYHVNDPLPSDANMASWCEPDLRDSNKDTVASPCLRRVETYPMNARVVPVINTLLGFRARAHRNVYVHLETGWRLVGFYLGAGPEFRF
jgi:hypothetical protein